MKVFTQFYRYIFLVLILAVSHGLNASHGTSGSITYRCVDTNIGRYEITLNVLRYCYGVSLGSQNIQIHSAQLNTTILMGSPTIKEITPVCNVPDVNVPVVTNCPHGPIAGISGLEKHTYKTTVILGKNLGWALIGWGTCCRESGLSTINGAQGIWMSFMRHLLLNQTMLIMRLIFKILP